MKAGCETGQRHERGYSSGLLTCYPSSTVREERGLDTVRSIRCPPCAVLDRVRTQHSPQSSVYCGDSLGKATLRTVSAFLMTRLVQWGTPPNASHRRGATGAVPTDQWQFCEPPISRRTFQTGPAHPGPRRRHLLPQARTGIIAVQ